MKARRPKTTAELGTQSTLTKESVDKYIVELETIVTIYDLKSRPEFVCNVDKKGVTPLRKHAYSNTLKILPPKNGNFSDKTF